MDDDTETRKAQFQLLQEEAEWQERWHPLNPAPVNTPDIGPIVRSLDEQLLQAAQILSLGPGVVSPLSVNRIRVALTLWDAEQDLDRGDITGDTYDELCHMLLDNEVEDTRKTEH